MTTQIADLIATDTAVNHYSREGSFGWLHHELRTPATDGQLATAAFEAGYTAEEFAGLLISKMGRWAGDLMSFADGQAQLAKFLADRKTRSWCRTSIREYRAELTEATA